MYNKSIKKLVDNIPIPNVPIQVDLVLEGGAFNGSYELGALLVLRELEKRGIIQIDRISGASVGAILSILYKCDKLDKYINYYSDVRENWKTKLSLNCVKKFVKENIKKYVTPDLFKQIQNGKVYITYYDTTNNQQIVKSEYTDVKDLTETVLRSINIPYIMFDTDESGSYIEDNFIDGAQPYIFHNRESANIKKILYLSINHYGKIKNTISTKNENTPNGRILEGILECYNFFLNGRSNGLCSYVNNWSLMDYASIRINKIIITGLLYLLSMYRYAVKLFYPVCKDTTLYKIVSPVVKNFIKDFLLYISF